MMAKEQSYADFAREHGLITDYDVQGHLHAGLMAAHMPNSYHRWYRKRLVELQDARLSGLEKYDAAVRAGEVNPPAKPSRLDRLRTAASGHPDLPSTAAAQRLLERMAS